MLELFVALLIGLLTGIITGITPGLHINLVAVLVLSFSPSLLAYVSPLFLSIYIISMAITHTFLDTLPSIYLGAPDEGQALNALPGHRLLLRGEGHAAVVYNLIGALGSIVLSILLFPLFIVGMKVLSPLMEGLIAYLLIGIVTYMIWREKENRWKSLALFLLAGCLGLAVLGNTSLQQPLFPLLSGLFGLSLLITSINEKTTIPQQQLEVQSNISRKNLSKSVTAASGMGFIAAFLPGFGSSQAAILATNVVGDIGDEGFISLVAGINTANMLISIATAYALHKSRNGAILVINKILDNISLETMLIFIGVSLLAAGIATLLTLHLSKVFARFIVKVNYRHLVLGIMVFIALLAAYFDGWRGLLILAVSSAIGLLASSWKVAKNHLMGCLMVPVILYFIL